MGLIEICKVMTTETAHRLQRHNGKCRHLHGHRYSFEVILQAAEELLPKDGMLVDFSIIKANVGSFLEDSIDHAVILEQGDPLIEAISSADPSAKICILTDPPTAECIARHVALEVRRSLPFVALTKVTCWETATSFASYTPYGPENGKP